MGERSDWSRRREVAAAVRGRGPDLAADPGPGAGTAPSPGLDPGPSLVQGQNHEAEITPVPGPGTVAPGPGQVSEPVLPTGGGPGPRIATVTPRTVKGRPQGQGRAAVHGIAGIVADLATVAGPGTGAAVLPGIRTIQ